MFGISMEHWLQWIGCAMGLGGSLLLALNCRVSGWGFVLFLVSNVFWISFGLLTDAPGIVVMNLGFSGTSLMGVWKWLVLPAIEHHRLYGRPIFLSRTRRRYRWGRA